MDTSNLKLRLFAATSRKEVLRNSLRTYREATELFDVIIHLPKRSLPSTKMVDRLRKIRGEILPVLANETLPSSKRSSSPELAKAVRALLSVNTSPNSSMELFNLAEAVWDGASLLWRMSGGAKFYRGDLPR